jgi:hypothetical protein
VIDGERRIEAAKLLGLGSAPCIRIDHLSDDEQRLLRLAVNRLGEKGQWNLDELKIEFEELILSAAPIEISGFSLDEIDQIVIGDDLDGAEQGPLEPGPGSAAVARLSDVLELGPHRLVCGSATDPVTLRRLMEGDSPESLAEESHERLELRTNTWPTGGGPKNALFWPDERGAKRRSLGLRT